MTNVFYAGNDDDNKGENAGEDGNKANNWIEEGCEDISFSSSGNVGVLVDGGEHSIQLNVISGVNKAFVKKNGKCG